MKLRNLAATVLPFAKTLGTALGGPVGPIVNMALTVAGKALGVEADARAIETAMLQDPDALIKLRKAEMHFEAEMKRLDVDVYALEVQDRGSARDLAKVNVVPHVTLSIAFIGGYFTIVWQLFSGHMTVPDNMRDQGALLLGVLTVNIPIIMQFWFGSSFGSKVKDQTIKEQGTH